MRDLGLFLTVSCGLALTSSTLAFADDTLHVGAASLDPPTVVALGVQLLVTGDDNFNASVGVRYRKTGTTTWTTGAPLFRVHPEVVTVPADVTQPAPQFAGSIFDLAPSTSYDIELHATDSDGAIDQIVTMTGSTRPVPGDPKSPNAKTVTDAASLKAALAAAAAGDVITLANGTYSGELVINASGTADNPIVIRGASEEGVILDGANAGGNVLEVYGSFVHVERLTMQNDNRAIRFQTAAATDDVVRRVHTKNTVLGFGSQPNQANFYICDNTLEGKLVWPAVYSDDKGAHANDDGIHIEGNGHVVCHNEIHGFGDAMKTEQDGAVAIDFYGNDVTATYDNAIELDTSTRNTRAFRNRFTNTYAPLSFQPIFGGPVYAFRNVVVNVAWEQLKAHALGVTPVEDPSGLLIYHNTFVSAGLALNEQDDATAHYVDVENNLFVGPATTATGKTVDWTGTLDHATFDYDGYTPDGVFAFDTTSAGYVKSANFAALQATSMETHGLLLTGAIFASGLVAPADYKTSLASPDVSLTSSSNAIDKGHVLPNFNDGFQGSAPDLGAIERGCAPPIYGVRPEGVDETNEVVGCPTSTSNGGDGGISADGGSNAGDGGSNAQGNGDTNGTGGSDSSGCGCTTAMTRGSFAWWSMVVGLGAIVVARMKRRK